MPAPKGNQNAKGNKGGGRKSGYKPEYADIARQKCELGATYKDLADEFRVGVGAINNWKSSFVEFAKALKVGKAPADDRVEASLYHRATGYTFESEKIFQFQGEIIRAKTVEHVPPDTTAMIFWLKNRRPDDWREKQEFSVKRDLSSMSEAEITDALVQVRRMSAPKEGA